MTTAGVDGRRWWRLQPSHWGGRMSLRTAPAHLRRAWTHAGRSGNPGTRRLTRTKRATENRFTRPGRAWPRRTGPRLPGSWRRTGTALLNASQKFWVRRHYRTCHGLAGHRRTGRPTGGTGLLLVSAALRARSHRSLGPRDGRTWRTGARRRPRRTGQRRRGCAGLGRRPIRHLGRKRLTRSRGDLAGLRTE